MDCTNPDVTEASQECRVGLREICVVSPVARAPMMVGNAICEPLRPEVTFGCQKERALQTHFH